MTPIANDTRKYINNLISNNGTVRNNCLDINKNNCSVKNQLLNHNKALTLQVDDAVDTAGLFCTGWRAWHCKMAAKISPQRYLELAGCAKEASNPARWFSWKLKQVTA